MSSFSAYHHQWGYSFIDVCRLLLGPGAVPAGTTLSNSHTTTTSTSSPSSPHRHHHLVIITTTITPKPPPATPGCVGFMEAATRLHLVLNELAPKVASGSYSNTIRVRLADINSQGECLGGFQKVGAFAFALRFSEIGRRLVE
ncbi:hypothetical protein Tco_1329078 [Tanacetum coccineum]